MVMAQERAPTIATMIHTICCHEGHPGAAPAAGAERAASNAPISANGSANTECSNLIISRMVRMRDVLTRWFSGLQWDRLFIPSNCEGQPVWASFLLL